MGAGKKNGQLLLSQYGGHSGSFGVPFQFITARILSTCLHESIVSPGIQTEPLTQKLKQL